MSHARTLTQLFHAFALGFSLSVMAMSSHTLARTSSTDNGIQTQSERPFVVMLQATDEIGHSPWFQGLDNHATNAAQALNIEFKHLFAGDDRANIPQVLRDYVKDQRRPDYLLISNQIEVAPRILKLSEELGIKVFMYNSPIFEKDRDLLGGPRENLRHWIGEILPDDEQAGFDLANILIKDAHQKRLASGKTGKIKIVGIAGTVATPASVLRVEGLKRAISMRDDVELLQVVSARWSPSVAARKYKLLVSRYGDFDAVWAANDDMALAVLEEARFLGQVPVIGGFDWTPPAIQALKKGELSASMGGHDFEVAFALKLIRDYHDGRDFLKLTKTPSLRSKLSHLTSKNVGGYSDFLADVNERNIDYSEPLVRLTQSKDDFANISIEAFKKHVAMASSQRGTN